MPAPDSYPHVTCGCTVEASAQSVAAMVTTAPKRGNSTTMGIFLSDVTC